MRTGLYTMRKKVHRKIRNNHKLNTKKTQLEDIIQEDSETHLLSPPHIRTAVYDSGLLVS